MLFDIVNMMDDRTASGLPVGIGGPDTRKKQEKTGK
jgi:hypothetical protein